MRASTERVSIIIPFYNAEHTLARAIRSALDQSINKEILLVDNGSTDGSPAIASKFASDYAEIKLLSETKKGAPAARNTALKAATGTFFQFLDADDELQENKIPHQLEQIPENGFIAGAYKEVHHSPERMEVFSPAEDKPPLVALFLRELGITSANLFSRAALERVNGWNEAQTTSQEYELMFRMLAANIPCACSLLPETNVYQTEGSVSRKNQAASWDVFLRLRLAIKKLLMERVIFDKYEIELNIYTFHMIRVLYNFNPARAIEYYMAFFPHRYVPWKDQRLALLYKVTLYLLGFKITQRIWKLVKRMS